MKYFLMLMAIAMVSLMGCTDDGSATKEVETTLFDSQLNALDKTRNIENVLQQSADERQNEIDVE
ncbi:MAG: hypothetical protein P1U35_03715 [Cycloclasticus sp.]|jgi:hypothetical protein|nr:hypothetical protein [Cycloclasticus sp.]